MNFVKVLVGIEKKLFSFRFNFFVILLGLMQPTHFSYRVGDTVEEFET